MIRVWMHKETGELFLVRFSRYENVWLPATPTFWQAFMFFNPEDFEDLGEL